MELSQFCSSSDTQPPAERSSPHPTLPELKSKPPAGITRMDLTEKKPLGMMLKHPLKADKIPTKHRKHSKIPGLSHPWFSTSLEWAGFAKVQ